MRDQITSVTALGGRKVIPADAYTLEAMVIGSTLRLSVNGVEVASVSDATLTINAYMALSVCRADENARCISSGAGVGVAIFSDFVFTPLPASPVGALSR